VTVEETDEEIDLTDEQKDVLDLSESFSVTAGAGTGKTLVLTERYVRALEEPGVYPENIVTITFTKKATNEMEERIREELIERLEEAETDEEYAKWRDILDEFEESYIHTIHGFCSRLLREYGVEAPVVPGFDVVEGTERDNLQREAVEAVLDEPEPTERESIEELSEIWDRDTLSGVLEGMLDPDALEWAKDWNKKDTEYIDRMWELCGLSAEKAREVTTSEEFRGAIEDLRDVFRDGFSLPKDHKAKSSIETLREITEHPAAVNPDEASDRESLEILVSVYHAFEKNSGGLYAGMGYVLGGKSKWSGMRTEYETIRPAAETLLELIEPYEDDLQTVPGTADENAAEYVPNLANLVLAVHEEYDKLKDEINALDYDDLIDKTIKFLKSDDEARREISDGFSHVMVDEFQDTDPRQWDLVKLLTGHGEEDYGSDSVFLVGDEKQSIYAFRGADVTAFGRAKDELEGKDKPLSGNFRTLQTPLDFLNGLFEDVFESFDESGRKDYEAEPQELSMERDRAEDIGGLEGSVEYHVVPEEAETTSELSEDPPEGLIEADSSGERDAEATAAKIAGVLNGDYTVYDEDEDEARTAEPRDVAVLLRRRTHLKKYERALEDKEVPYTVVSGVGFYDTPEVEYLVNLLRALSDPTDDISLYGVLRSPLFGFTDDELARLAKGGELWDSLENIETGDVENEELRHAYDSLSRWRTWMGFDDGEDTETIGWDRLITRVIEETGYLSSVAAGDRSRQAQANIEKFRQQLRAWSDGGVRTPSELLRRLRLQQEGEDQGEATIPADTEGVRILTIHSAKGLEFPIVVVPDLDRGINFSNSIENEVVLGEIDGTSTVGLKAPMEDRYDRKKNLAWRRIDERNESTTRAEEKRVLYVACTRTRDHLILCGQHEIELEGDKDETPSFSEPEDNDEAGCWRDWVQPVLLDDDVAEELKDTDGSSVRRTLNEAQYTITVPTSSPDYERPSPEEIEPPRTDIPEAPSSEKRLLYATQLLDDHGHTTESDTDTEADELEEGTDSISRDAIEGTEAESVSPDKEIPPTVFGTVVHKICELDPPEERWPEYIRKTAQTEGYDPSDADVEEILEHAREGVEYARESAEGDDVVSTHDEVYITAELDDVRVSGEIDRLAAKQDSYHIVDYKTNSLSNTSPDELLEHYRPQLVTYATAVRQSYPGKAIEATLVFTENGETRSLSWSAESDVSKELKALIEEFYE
jgi:ATP-dependent helicase/nuclease subunit A